MIATVLFPSNRVAELKIKKETEKAIGFAAWKQSIFGGKAFEWTIWVPKSVCKNGIIADWFISKTVKAAWQEDSHIVVELA